MQKYKITFGNTEVPASEYQCKIFDCIEHGNENLIINAAAGSAKTTTIVNGINYIRPNKKVCFVAFNKDIAEKLQEEVKRDGVDVSTFHSLGYKILFENDIVKDDTPINEYKYTQFIKENIDKLTQYKETKSLGRKRSTYITNIKNITEYCRYWLAFSKRQIKNVAKFYGVATVRDELEVVEEILKWGKKELSEIDYTDMIWLPNVLNLTTKRYLYDFIFIDEGQDTNMAEQGVIDKCFKRGTRFCVVGDDYQKINTWCGASENAIEKFEQKGNVLKFELPISYRCPKKIVEFVRERDKRLIIKAAPDAIDGTINMHATISDPKDGDMILCRTTAPLVELQMKFHRMNKRSFIRGFEKIKKQYIDLINNSHSTLIDKNCLTSDGLFPRLYGYLFNEIERKMNVLHLDEEDTMALSDILEIYDNIEALKVLSEGLLTTKELIDKIHIIFNGDIKDGIQLSTVHKAKGLESKNVFIYMPSLLPLSLATKDWEIETEANLEYVAYTRTKNTLNFIEEDKKYHRMSDGSFSYTVMKNKLDEIKKQISYNKEMGIKEETINHNTLSSNVLGGQKQIINKTQPIKKKAGLKFSSLME